MTYFQKKAIHTLRVNIKSLQEESRIIRKEIRICKDKDIRSALHFHRINRVRSEARITQLAMGFVKGKTFADIEKKSKTQPDWGRLFNKIKTHYYASGKEIDKWIEEAKQSFNR